MAIRDTLKGFLDWLRDEKQLTLDMSGDNDTFVGADHAALADEFLSRGATADVEPKP